MLIAFWAPIHGQGAVTSNMFTSAFIMGLHYKLKVILMHTQSSYNNLEGPLIGKPMFKTTNMQDLRMISDMGIDALVRNSKAAPLSYNMIEGCCGKFEDTNVMLLPGTYKERKVFEKETKGVLTKLFSNLNEHINIIMVDVNSGEDEFSRYVMEKADLIVVNLPQNMFVTKRIFEIEQSITEKDNVFYLFGMYDDGSKYNISNLRQLSSLKQIKKSNSGAIPYCTKFKDAQSDRKVIEFIENCLELPKKSPREEYYYIHKSKLAVEKMLGMLKISIRPEKREGEV